MSLYPILLNLKEKEVLVIGLGKVGTRKTMGLLNTGCKLTVMGKNQEKLNMALSERKSRKSNLIENILPFIDFRKNDFEIGKDEDILRGKTLIFVCTSDKDLNEYIALKAKDLGILCLRADEGMDSDFINPSVIEKEKLIISISSSGNSPAYSRLVKEMLEDIVSGLDTDSIELMGRAREKIKKMNIKDNEKRELLKRLPFMNKEELKSYEDNCGNKG
ncbi:siroheme synthase-like protein [Acetoanaerobium pronyense]|uniref:precorrin-2 dehydrogenase n=1 Tax=Acetoanaerobium pronyense TaxID=1482736 RepID=A0ABS4KIW4_9FIRM|nr:bifunctional precorrin-2 dehydrogenase/sirohydrochlorin ferrochelatase [Acetoanaerobium pronyense]MBP2027695.1 siroheme synthase-like protein [Acetoanaerobium pronyense]